MRLVLTLLLACAFVFFACSSDDETHHGLALIVATNLKTPEDLDAVRLEVFQEKSPDLPPDAGDRYLSTGTDFTVRVPDEQPLPGTFTIAAGTAADQNAYIRITGLKSGKPIVLREIRIQIPTTRVAQYLVVLSTECVNRLVVDGTGRASAKCDEPDETCLPDSKEADKCGASFVDSNGLQDFDPAKYKDLGTLPLAPIPEAGVGPEPAFDAGEDAGDAGEIDAGPPAITAFTISGSTGLISGTSIFVRLKSPSNLKGLVPAIQLTGTKVTPANGEAQDFDQGPVTYTVSSGTLTKSYTVTVRKPVVPGTPTFTPGPGQYPDNPLTINVSSPPGAVTHYTKDGSTPTASSPSASNFTLTKSSTVLWLTVEDGYEDVSDVLQYVVSDTALSAVISPPSQELVNAFAATTINSATNDATYCYRTDGNPAGCTAGVCAVGSTSYAGPFLLDFPTNSIRAVTCRSDLETSGVSTNTYSWQVATPLFDKPSGHYAAGTTVNVTTETMSTAAHPVGIHYNLSGADPGCAATSVSGPSAPIALPAGHTVITVRACNGHYPNSAIATATYDVP